jgi:hypothetical protein
LVAGVAALVVARWPGAPAETRGLKKFGNESTLTASKAGFFHNAARARAFWKHKCFLLLRKTL